MSVPLQVSGLLISLLLVKSGYGYFLLTGSSISHYPKGWLLGFFSVLNLLKAPWYRPLGLYTLVVGAGTIDSVWCTLMLWLRLYNNITFHSQLVTPSVGTCAEWISVQLYYSQPPWLWICFCPFLRLDSIASAEHRKTQTSQIPLSTQLQRGIRVHLISLGHGQAKQYFSRSGVRIIGMIQGSGSRDICVKGPVLFVWFFFFFTIYNL